MTDNPIAEVIRKPIDEAYGHGDTVTLSENILAALEAAGLRVVNEAVIIAAVEQFEGYAKNHRAKGADEKAHTNEYWGNLLRKALASPTTYTPEQMVERVAEALDPPAFLPSSINDDPAGLGYSARRAKARDKARAAIRAMKTPTVEMYDAAWKNIQINPELEQARQKLAAHDFRLLIRNIFGAMCRAALGEDEGHEVE